MTTDLFGGAIAKPATPLEQRRRDNLTFRGNVAEGRHGWLRLTPAYSLHLVRDILANLGRDGMVLEPFSGTGTTPLACASAGVRCHAIDINPFLVWFGNLKLSVFSDEDARVVRSLAEAVVEAARAPGAPCWTPPIHQIEKWWDAAALRALGALHSAISALEREHPAHRVNLLRVAFCRTMIGCANVSFGHQSMSFKKSRQPGLLLGGVSADNGAAVLRAFRADVEFIASTLPDDAPAADARVVLGDSRRVDDSRCAPDEPCVAVITSPPYPNRMSYIRELRPYMYWLGHLADGRAAGDIDWEAIGGTWGSATSRLKTWEPEPHEEIPFPAFSIIVRDIGERHELLGAYVRKYFHDIKAHILSLRSVLASGATCHYIVGNSKFYDTLLPVERIYAALFADAGFADVRIETIRKRTSKKELFEYVVHARKP